MNLKYSYYVPNDDVVNDFLIPALKDAIRYDRASGYFSSLSLLELAVGIKELYEKHGKIWLIISPEIQQKDAEAIKDGYRLKHEKTISEVKEWMVNSSFITPKTIEEEERYNILSHLIADGVLEIKIAIMKNNPDKGIFHDKTGFLEDSNGDWIVFDGSMNETDNGFYHNHESIDVFSTIRGESGRINEKFMMFEMMWNNEDPSIEVFDFPKDLKYKIDQYHKKEIDWNYSLTHAQKQIEHQKRNPHIPEDFSIRDYQEKAISKWVESNYRGFFDMATGTGKTYTAIAAIVKLFENMQNRLAIIIVVPYIHLIPQWAKDLEKFGIKTIQGFSGSENKHWKEHFKTEIRKLNWGISKYVCLLTTNATFRLKRTQELIDEISVEKCLVVDEAHNFRAPTLIKQLDERFKYRLGLSATLGNEHDETVKIMSSYFSPVCIHYSLGQAIDDGMLCQYRYYPIPVYLTEDEWDEYIELSEKINKYVERDRRGNIKLNSDGSPKFKPEALPLLIKRSRLVAGAANKLSELSNVLDKIENKDHLLVYCGATTVNAQNTDYSIPGTDELRQIEAVNIILREKYGLKTAKFTSQESLSERGEIIERFDSGEIEAITAIRCLDEGVDIPSIKTAILLASSTNPKEYVQRRGRVLRLFKDKSTAEIYDLITLPADADPDYITANQQGLGLVKREIKRVKEFMSTSINHLDSLLLIDDLEEKYGYILENKEEEVIY